MVTLGLLKRCISDTFVCSLKHNELLSVFTKEAEEIVEECKCARKHSKSLPSKAMFASEDREIPKEKQQSGTGEYKSYG